MTGGVRSIGPSLCPRAASASSASIDAVDVVAVGLDVWLEAVLAQRLARDRADRDDPRGRARPAAPPARLQEEAHGRGGGEGDVVGLRAPRAAPAARAARRRSHTAPARPPRRRARAARRGARRAPRARARSARASPGTSASASTSDSATKRSGTTSAMIPCSASARAVPGPIAATVRAGERARVPAGGAVVETLEQRRHAVGAGQADEVVGRGVERRAGAAAGRG